ncbi:MAG: quinone-dependent dihydroorotate dehydrogenase [Gemmatimonadetes bacterium]|nr:MAG: quinone-dependent dihydroorotate dehydrogenase [Gemmatimonadota bacterium]
MLLLYKSFIRPLVFEVDPEVVHEGTMAFLRAASPMLHLIDPLLTYQNPRLHVSFAGLHFPNPVGLAAGFDKNAHGIRFWHHFGFGHVEVGTVTAQGQPGNPKPRLFRYPADRAIINRMGFNNDGATRVARRLRQFYQDRTCPIPLGINIGKTKVVPLERAVEDYCASFEKLYPFGDYFTVNVSSPNTPNLRELQNKDELHQILAALQAKNNKHKPIFLKIAPDVTEGQLEDIVTVVQEHRIDGIIATNTTISREGVRLDEPQTGGLSGQPLRRKSTEIIHQLYHLSDGSIPIIGVGGIFTGDDAYEKILAGASLVQIYTGFIYEGPRAVWNICRRLIELMDRDGWKSIGDAVGASH